MSVTLYQTTWHHIPKYRVRINYRRILQKHIFTNTRPDSVWFLHVVFRQGQSLRPTTSKDTTRIARAHQHRNRERHTRHAWEGLARMGVSPGHLPCHTWGRTSNAFKVTMKLQTFLFQMVVTSCISVQYLWKYGFAKSSDNLYALCIFIHLHVKHPLFLTDLNEFKLSRPNLNTPPQKKSHANPSNRSRVVS